MPSEQDYFIRILADYLNKRQTVPQKVDWGIIAKYANIHQVSGIVYHQCRDLLPTGEAAQHLARQYAMECYYYSHRKTLYAHVREAFIEAHIPFFAVKGLEVSRYYPIPALRTMGDCDIVVHEEDKKRAENVMLGLGFKKAADGAHEWIYYKNGMEIELHHRLLYDEVANSDSSKLFCDGVWEHVHFSEGRYCGIVDDTFHLVFLLLHLKKHLIHVGIGFRQFMDLAVMVENAQINRLLLGEWLEKLDLLQFGQICFALVEKWFGIPSTLGGEDIGAAFFQEATGKILGNGIFGFQDEQNDDNTACYTFCRKNRPRWWLRICSGVNFLFPDYRSVRYVQSYHFVDGRPWLLPVIWGYRAYRAVRDGKLSHVKKMAKRIATPKKRIDQYREELSRWGL